MKTTAQSIAHRPFNVTGQELSEIQASLRAGKALSEDQAERLIEYIARLEEFCDDADDFDVFGGDGWRERVGRA